MHSILGHGRLEAVWRDGGRPRGLLLLDAPRGRLGEGIRDREMLGVVIVVLRE